MKKKEHTQPQGDKELEQVTCESDAKLDQNHEHSSGMQESIEAEGTEERVLTSHTEMCEVCEVASVEEGHDFERDELHRALKSALEAQVIVCLTSGSAFFRIMWDLVWGRRSSMQKAALNDRTPSRTV